MEAIIVLIGIFYTFSLGYLIARKSLPYLKKFQLIGLGLSVGMGIIYFQLYIYSLLGIEWNLAFILIPGIVAIGLLKGKLEIKIKKFKLRRMSPLVVLITLAVLYVGFESISRPLLSWDGWATWLLKSKMFYIENGINPGHFFYSGSDYPLVISLFITFLYKLIGGVNDKYSLLIYPSIYISFIFLMFSTLRNFLSIRKALLFTFLFVLLQNIIRHAGYYETGMSDFPLSYFIFVDYFLFITVINKKNILSHILLHFLIGLTALIKVEGIVYAIVLEIVIFFCLFRKKRYKYIAFSLVYLATWLSWEFYKLSNNISLNSILIDRRFNGGDFFTIIFGFIKEMLNVKNWNFLWPAFVLGFFNFLVNFKRIPYKSVYVLIFAQLTAYYIIFLMTPVRVSEHLSILDRLLIHVSPLAIFAIAMNFYKSKNEI